jgi:aminocarboxymuconate-semialdehyde decarboxylase
MEGQLTKLIDVHIHFLPSALEEVYTRRSDPPCISSDGGQRRLVYSERYSEPIGSSDTRRADLDSAMASGGVDIALVSINQPGVIGLSAKEATSIARDANDELLDMVSSSGGSIQGLATLPWQNPGAAVDELERTSGLGLRGAMMYSNVAGESVDREQFRPVFAAASTLSAPLLLHPTLPLHAAHLSDCRGLIPSLGFLVDTTAAVLRMLATGELERHSDLKIVVAHSGSLLPALSGRLDEEWTRGGLDVKGNATARPTSLLRGLYTDTVGGSVRTLDAARELFGVDHMMFGSDYPFWQVDRGVETLHEFQVTPEELALIRGETATRLFHIPVPV